MRFLFATVLMMLFSFATTYFLPWWCMAIVCFFVSFLFKLRGGQGFLSGFVAIFLLWLIVALFKDVANEQILSTRMAALFKLGNAYLFIIIGALVGGITGGLAAWSGASVYQATNRT